MVNAGGRLAGSRYGGAHVGPFIGPYPALNTTPPVSSNLLVFTTNRDFLRRAPHIGHPLVTPAVLPSPVGGASIVRAKQPRYVTRSHITSILGPQPGGPPVSSNLLYHTREPAYVTHPHLMQILAPPAPAPLVSRSTFVRTGWPRYRTKILLRAWLGPYPNLGAISRNRLVRAVYPRYPTHHTSNPQWVYQVPKPVVSWFFRRTLSALGTRIRSRQNEVYGPAHPPGRTS